jgi:hypothetical protein
MQSGKHARGAGGFESVAYHIVDLSNARKFDVYDDYRK